MGKFTTRKKRKRKRKTEIQILCTLLSVSGREIRVRRFILKVKKEMKEIIKGKKRKKERKGITLETGSGRKSMSMS